MQTTMTNDQINAYNELGQMIMTATGCSSDEATEKILSIMGGMVEVLDEGVLS